MTFEILAMTTAKVAFVLACAAGLTRALSRRSASVQHLVWATALGCTLVLPLASQLLPEWRLPLVPALATSRGPLQALPGSAEPVVGAVPDSATSHSASDAPLAWTRLVLLAWAIGAVTTMLRLIAGIAGLWWMARRAEVDPPVEWHALVGELSRRLGVTQRVRVLCSATTSMPLSWGWVRPAILLPDSAITWTSDRRRAVLLHELAHVKRRDCLTQLVAQMACAVHWFNPLVWMAAARLRVERERACDDVVLACGTRSSEYATHLLDIARGFRVERVPSWAALAMARPSQLEGRLLAILDPLRPRHGLTRKSGVAVAGGAVVVAALVAAAQPVVGADPSQAPSSQTQIIEPQRSIPSSTPAKRRLVDALLPALQDADKAVRQQAVTALGEVDDPSAVEPLVKMLRDSEAEVRGHAAAALGEIRDRRSTDALIAALGDAVATVRAQAVRALGELRDPKAVDALTALLKDADVRRRAVAALSEIRDGQSGRVRD